MKQQRPYPQVIVSRKAARSLAAGHVWVFDGEVRGFANLPDGAEQIENGSVVDVVEENGTWQGAGLYSQLSRICVRIVTRNANDRIDEAFWERKMRWAWEMRKRVMGADLDCCRVVFSEADGFPGLVIDRYQDVLVAQVGTFGMEQRRELLFGLALRVLTEDGQDVRAIFERCDSPVRKKEGLELRVGWWDGSPSVPDSPRITVRENGILYGLDLENSQKTGFFLDQKYNRAAVARLAKGARVMDCFCHVGPFGLNAAAAGAEYVRFVDASAGALDLVRANVALNGFEEARFGYTCADALDYLSELAKNKTRLREEGGPFDLIVLDPPAFAKRGQDVRNAARAYRQINECALRMLPRGGYLATCSCSQHMTRDLLAQAVAEAAHNAGVSLKQLEERQQAPDHPILWGVPETHYLDFFIFQVV